MLAAELKAGGFTVEQLREAGFSAAQLKVANFSALALMQGKDPSQLLRVGLSVLQRYSSSLHHKSKQTPCMVGIVYI